VATRKARKPRSVRRYRILTQQAQSVVLEKSSSFQVEVGQYECNLFLKPMHEDPSRQRVLGGALVHLEYESEERDMLRAASLGIRLTEDLLAGLAIVTGVPLGGVALIQIIDVTIASITPFLFTMTAPHMHSDEAITEPQLAQLRAILAHWDALPKGNRLRRAGGLYWRGLQQDDDLNAFQCFYMGLEALEPALADQIGVSAGVEQTKGNCESCGAEFVKNRTVLNGVRAYITGAQHPGTATAERKAEWNRINEFRHKQFHSLVDPETLYSAARQVLPAAAHFLHDAICCLSHAHALESPEFRLLRGTRPIVFMGTAKPGILDGFEECRPIVDLNDVGWDAHPDYGFVPRIGFRHDRPGVDIGGRCYWLEGSLRLASEANLTQASVES